MARFRHLPSLLLCIAVICIGKDWRQEELRDHECRSCRAVPVNSSNCPSSGFTCDEAQPLRAAVLTTSDECRCQTVKCANREWRLAVNGAIVDKIKCKGNEWITSSGLPAPSVVCAKNLPDSVETTTDETTTTDIDSTTTALATTTTNDNGCVPPPEPWKCNKAPFAGAIFSPACYNDPEWNLPLSMCVGDHVLVFQVPDVLFTGYYVAQDGIVQCQTNTQKYSANTFATRFEVSQVACMPCPHMTGDVTTTYGGAHEPAIYDVCKARCNNGNLFGKQAGGGFARINGVSAYYAYTASPTPKFVFLDKDGTVFEADFYCENSA